MGNGTLDTLLVALVVACATALGIARVIDTPTLSSLLGGAIGYAGRSSLAAVRNAKNGA